MWNQDDALPVPTDYLLLTSRRGELALLLHHKEEAFAGDN